MSDGYEVTGPELVSHARRLDVLADELRAALSAAKQVNVIDDAYGEPGRRFTGLLAGLGEAGENTVRAGVEAVEYAGRQLRATLADYDATEVGAARSLGGGEPGDSIDI